MKFEPHAYQAYAIEYIKSHPVTALLLDMGLGKTVTTLTAIRDLMYDDFEVSKVLVIAPLRVARDTWPEEIQKWDHLKDLSCSVVVGAEEERLAALWKEANVYIINRENVPWLIEESGVPFTFDMLVIDELSSFKNWKAKRFKALMQVRPLVKRVVGLTGTPSSNSLMDLFAEFKLLDMGERLGRFIGRYRSTYFMPDKRNGMVVYSYKLQADAEERIYHKISDITISMKASDHLQMPKLIAREVEVTLSPEERRLYNKLKRELVLELAGGEVTAANAASLTGKLTQLANGAVYGDEASMIEVHDRKLDALEDIIEAANGKPILVAYWYQHDLERICGRFPEAEKIGSSESIHRWNEGKISVGLIHPASAGHGLNLQQGGNHLVWFGLTWSLELYQQTNARLYRQGQQSGTVVIQHLMAKNTIDENILAALKKKDMSQAALIDAVKAEVTK